MSDSVAKSRSGGESRQSIDLDELERRMRESVGNLQQQLAAQTVPPPPPSAPAASDPLAELARLVGSGNDPFRKVFADRNDGLTMPPPGRASAPSYDSPGVAAANQYDLDRAFGRPAQMAPCYMPAPEPARTETSADPYASQAYQAPQPAAGAYDPAYGQAYGQNDAPWIAPEAVPYADYPEEPQRRTGRAKLLIGAAAAVVIAGGAGAYFLSSSDGGSRQVPTIPAQQGPAKVQPAEAAKSGTSQQISVLERGGAPNSTSRVVQSDEQPLDLANASRGQGANRPPRNNENGAPVTIAPPPPPPVANSIFSEPRRVKAVAVRPDGSIIDPNAPAPAAAPPANAPAATAAAAPPPAPVGRPMDIASIVNATAPPAGGARVAAAPPSPPVQAARPVAPAAPAPVAPAASAGAPGSFSVQLAGTSSEDEARDALTRLTRRFATELGSYRPAVVKADIGSRTVYRVRINNLSSEDANTLCARLKAGGGSCFVARN
jgi:hypothetical protein